MRIACLTDLNLLLNKYLFLKNNIEIFNNNDIINTSIETIEG